MAALDEMKVKIGVDLADLLSGMQKAGKSVGDFRDQLKRFQDQLNKSSDPQSIIRLNRAIDAAQEKIKLLTGAGVKAGEGLDKVKGGTNTAAQALQNLGRIAQDAPFGFIGISNNLNPMLESFQRLKAESGSSSTALKAMASSLVGVGGLGLAVSIATSLLVVFGDKLFSTKKATSTAKADLDYLKSSQYEYAEAVKKSNEEAGRTIANVSKLVAAAQLETTTYNERKDILKQLQSTSKEYFGNLTIENGIIVGLATAYDNYAQNIFKVAKAKAASGQIEKLGAELAKITGQINDLGNLQLSDKNGLVGGFDAAKKKYKELTDLIAKGGAMTFEDQKRLSELTGLSEQKVIPIITKREELRLHEGNLVAQILGLSKQVATEDIKSVGIHETKTKQVKEQVDLWQKLRNSIAKFREETLKNQFIDEAPGLPSAPASGTTGGTGIGVNKRDFGLEGGLGFESIIQAQQKAAANQALFNEQLAKSTAIVGVLKPSFDEMFSSIAAGGNVFESIGNSVKSLAIKLAEAAIEAAIFSAILNIFAPGVGSAASFKSLFASFSGLPKFAGGVTGFAGGYAIVGERGPEMVRLPQGSDVIPNHRLDSVTGRGLQVFIPELRLRGADLLVAFNRANQQNNRRG